MAYTKQGPFNNLAPPAFNATRATAMDQGIFDAHAAVGALYNIQESNVKPANSAVDNRTNLLNALVSSSRAYFFPAGDYAVDNATILTVSGFTGTLLFAPGATLVFSDNTKGGINFSGGTGARLWGMNYRYATSAPAQIDGQDGLRFTATTDSTVQTLHGQGSPSMGVQFYECVRPRLVDAYLHDHQRDGAHFANCQDFFAHGLLFDDVGDDALGISNLSTLSGYTGGSVSMLRAYNNAGAGVANYGHSDVRIDDVYAENTHGAAVKVAGRDATWAFRDPVNVVIDGVTGVDNGKGPQMSNLQGNDLRSGVVVYRDVDPTLTGEMDVVVRNVDIRSPYTSGVFVLVREGEVHLRNIRHVGGGAGRGIYVGAPRYTLKNVSTEGSDGYGAQLADAASADVDGLTIRNSSKTNTDRRALSVENNANSPSTAMRFTGRGIRVIDDQGTITGYNVVGYADATKTLDADFGGVELDLAQGLSSAAIQSFSGTATVRSSRYYVRQGSHRSRQTAAPTSGYWQLGDVVLNTAPTSGGTYGWVCITAGAPGTWRQIILQTT